MATVMLPPQGGAVWLTRRGVGDWALIVLQVLLAVGAYGDDRLLDILVERRSPPACGVGRWRMLVWSTPTAPELNNQGYIMVYTSDPDASVDLEIHDLSDPPDASPRGYWVWVIANVETEKTPVRWAVALGGDARIPPEETSVSGTMLRPNASPGRSGGFGDISSPNEPAYFVNGVEWPGRGEGTEEGDGSVIFGTEPNKHVVTGSVTGSVLGGFSINLTGSVAFAGGPSGR